MQKVAYDEILDNLPSSVFLVDEGNVIWYYNRRFMEYFKAKERGLGIGKSIGDSINCASFKGEGLCGKGKDCELCMINRMIKDMANSSAGSQKRIFEKWLKAGGEIKCYRMSLSIVSMEGGYCCVIDDITEVSDGLSPMSKKISMDLRRASLIQSQLLPRFDALSPLAEFVYYYQQSYLVGGDLFDLFKIDGRRFGGYIADVSGMGVSGGMLTMYLHDNYPREELSPSAALESFDKKFNSLNHSEESYITIFAFSVDAEEKLIRYCNAGHAAPALLKKEGGLVKLCSRGQTVSNWYEGASYSDKVARYDDADVLILFTDGLTDTRNIEGKSYTFERLCEVVEKSPRSMKDILKAVEVDLVEFCEGMLPHDSDDTTLLLITLK